MKDKKLTSVNPVLLLVLGAAPALGATTDLRAALAMGCAVLLVLLLTTLLLAALRKLVPESGKLAVTVLAAAGICSLVQLLMNAFLPAVYQMLGVYLAVVAVNLLVFSGAESGSVKDSLLSGLCFFAAVAVLGALREFFGAASFAGLSVGFMQDYKIPFLLQPAGGLMVFAIELAVIQAIFPARECRLPALTAAAVGKEAEQ